MVKLSKRDIEIIAVAIGAIDFYLEGALTKPVSRAFKAALAKAKPVATRGVMAGVSAAARSVPRIAGTAGMIAMRHPYIALGAVIYVAATNRNQVADLIRDGYDIVQPTVSTGLQTLADLDAPIVGTRRPAFTKKVQSNFNKAVSKGMKIVKGSTSYGKKGTISNAKKAFSVVTKVASAASKKATKPKAGIRRKIFTGIMGLFK